MGAPYSLDLRVWVVASVASGLSRTAAADRYQVSYSSVIRWVGRAKATGSPAALPMGGKKPFTLAEQGEWIRARLAEKPDITGRELLAELHEREMDVSYCGVWHFLDRAGLGFKKSLRASEQDRPDVARRREQWKRLQGKVAAERLVFIDGSRRCLERGQDERGPHAWTLCARPAPGRQGGAWSLANADLCSGSALRRYHRSLCVRQPDRWRHLSRLGDPVPGANLTSWRRCGDGQSQQP